MWKLPRYPAPKNNPWQNITRNQSPNIIQRDFFLDTLVAQVTPFWMLLGSFHFFLTASYCVGYADLELMTLWVGAPSGLSWLHFIPAISLPLPRYIFLRTHDWLTMLRFGLSCLSCHCQGEICSSGSDLTLQQEGRVRKSSSQFQVTF